MSRSDKSRPVAIAFGAKLAAPAVEGLESSGDKLTLYGNVIAQWVRGRLYVQVNGFGAGKVKAGFHNRIPADYAAGDFGRSPVTLFRLSMVAGVNVHRTGGKLFLNGQPWDGLRKMVAKPAAQKAS